MHRRIMTVLLITVMALGICSGLNAKGKETRNARTKPVEVKSSYNPRKTHVAVLPVTNIAALDRYVSGEIEKSLLTARSLIRNAFIERGFVVVADNAVAKTASQLGVNTDANAGLARKLDADLVVDCSIKELYTFVSGSILQRIAGVAVVNMKVYDAKEGYIISNDFLSRRNGPPGMLGWTTRNSEMREKALKGAVRLALDGLLKPYSTLDKSTQTAQDTTKEESSADSIERHSDKSADTTEQQAGTKAFVNTESAKSLPTQPQTVTRGPKYLLIRGHAMVPLKSIAQWLGASLDFNRKSGIIVLKTGSNTASLKLNSSIASINGRLVQLQSPVIERKGSTYMPLLFVCQAFGAKVKTDAMTGEIWIERPSSSDVMILSK